MPLDEGQGFAQRLRRLGGRITGDDVGADTGPESVAQRRLLERFEAEVRASTAELLRLHGLQGRADASVGEILQRVATQFEAQRKLPEGRAALLGGAITGALAGLKADLATGGLTLGGGLLAGGILGALGAAGLARGINRVRGTDRNWLMLSDAALDSALQAALLRYLAVAHYGRGRGGWVAGEAPLHWAGAVAAALAPRREAVAALWRSARVREDKASGAGAAAAAESGADSESGDAPVSGREAALADALTPLLQAALNDLLGSLYPGAG